MMTNCENNKILIIDDHPLGCKVAARLLENMGWNVKTAYNGYDGLKAAQEDYCMILLDLNLPDIQGLELAQKLRDKNHLKETKIIAVTGDVKHGLDYYALYGIDAILSKPFTAKQISQLVISN
ncbi:Putative response regulator receiver protein [Candidatus Phycorickettsia trachydisci]|uniref:Response regulator receiver protein n=1 Tax=Candidatus Phycorickettsia trachydisci TaxID=2115978 RepID=A0A2P1PA38_9RICK|nr:response regulator [Candidatus Phycorickettsia trachydisci]AVP88128.1 Putative response regulator receiver protein [Candidatus Phycorickettsia trachydisci]